MYRNALAVLAAAGALATTTTAADARCKARDLLGSYVVHIQGFEYELDLDRCEVDPARFCGTENSFGTRCSFKLWANPDDRRNVIDLDVRCGIMRPAQLAFSIGGVDGQPEPFTNPDADWQLVREPNPFFRGSCTWRLEGVDFVPHNNIRITFGKNGFAFGGDGTVGSNGDDPNYGSYLSLSGIRE